MSWQLLFAQLAGQSESVTPSTAVSLTGLGPFIASTNGRLLTGMVLGAVGLWLLMPRRWRFARLAGTFVGLASAACFLSLAGTPAWGVLTITFYILSGISLAAATGAVTSQSPIYCAIWFAVSLLGVGGLFMINGAQFLGVATVAVYAGAIVVLFLFVLMLAQPEGHAAYDRISWGRTAQVIGCCVGPVVAGAVSWATLDPNIRPRSGEHPVSVLAVEHVASLGAELFTRHLVSVQVAGLLLLAALVGAIAIASHASGKRGLQSSIEAALDTHRQLGEGGLVKRD